MTLLEVITAAMVSGATPDQIEQAIRERFVVVPRHLLIPTPNPQEPQ